MGKLCPDPLTAAPHPLHSPQSSLNKLSATDKPWQKVVGPAEVLFMALAQLRWTPYSAIQITTHTGSKLNFKHIAPAAVARLAAKATLHWSDI